MSAIVRRAKYSCERSTECQQHFEGKRDEEVKTYISIDGLMEMVDRRVLDSSVSSVNLIDELRDLCSESR